MYYFKRYTNSLSMQRILFTYSFLIISFVLSGQTDLGLLKDFKFLPTEEYAVIEDAGSSFDIHDIIDKPSSKWQKLHYFENLTSTYWLKYEFENSSKTDGKWVLELIDPHINTVEFYDSHGNLLGKQGFILEFTQRKYLHKNHVLDVHVPLNGFKVYYCRLSSTSQVAFTAKLQTNAYFSAYSLNEYFYLGIFYGFMIIMIAYNLILYFFTGMKTRIYYSLYVISATLNSVAEDGLGFQYLWPNEAWANTILPTIQPLSYLLCFLIYTFNLLDIKNPKIIKGSLLFLVIYTMYHVTCSYYRIPTRFWVPFYMIPFGFVIFQSLNRNFRRNTLLITIGTSLIFISYFIFYLRTNGWVENSIYVVYFFNFSVTIETILFSIAIGEKLRNKQRDHMKDKELVIEGLRENDKLKEKVNRELEDKVKERTEELEKTKKKLEEQAELITSMNLKLDLQNRDLNKKVVEVSQKRIHGEEIDPEEFHELYPNKLKCFLLLEDIKWIDGFVCRKCEGTKYKAGTSFRSRRCTKCGTSETPTSNTIFHGLRTPIDQMFYVFALVVHSKGKISTSDLEKKTGVDQKACWRLKQKIIERIEDHTSSNYSWKSLIENN